MHDADTWIMAGTSSSHIASHSGHQERSHSGGPVQNPPDGSGFTLQPTNPISVTHRRSSATEPSIATPGDCGSWHTGAKFDG